MNGRRATARNLPVLQEFVSDWDDWTNVSAKIGGEDDNGMRRISMTPCRSRLSFWI
jgi:hypothetical protein